MTGDGSCEHIYVIRIGELQSRRYWLAGRFVDLPVYDGFPHGIAPDRQA
jgi:hypothetical protein